MLERDWLIERAPARNGPWRYVKAVKCDVFSAIRTALELRTGDGWLRLVPEGRVQNATLINGSESE